MPESFELVNIYRQRQRHKRCRTCVFACEHGYSYWSCKAKGMKYVGHLDEEKWRGILCGLYEARKFGE